MKIKTKKFGVPEKTGRHNSLDLDRAPAPAVMAKGIGGVGLGQYWLEEGVRRVPRDAKDAQKPPYRVPLMSDLPKVASNGLAAASTFSGCGGSCLGLALAGFRVAWANEFLPVAATSHKANFPDTTLDLRDVKTIQPEEILAALHLKRGELDLLDGSPPCQAFSSAGLRSKGWGKERRYEHGATQKNEDLFFEFVRILEGLAPRAFVAENVAGLARGVAKGYFLDILARLKAAGYKVKARLLDAQWLGVPQSRQRIFFVGTRLDLGLEPAFPAPLPYRYSVADALPETFGPRDAIKIDNAHFAPTKGMYNGPTSAIKIVNDPNGQFKPSVRGVDQPSVTIKAGCSQHLNVLKVVAGSFEHFGKKRNVTRQPCPALLTAQPNHYMIEGDGSDAKRRDDKGAERRRFTIDELKRICAFPDDFALRGTYSQQWAQLGNAVPPLMMLAVARELARVLHKT